MITPKRLFTTWICDTDGAPYREKDKALFYKCFESWHRLMPDYDIRILNLENFTEGFDDAMPSGFWAQWGQWIYDQKRSGNYIGLSQWARLVHLYAWGGVYVDMDVSAVQRFDTLLDGTFFAGHEGGDPFVNNAIMGAPSEHPFLLTQLNYLLKLDVFDPQFGNESGPRMLTALLKQRGWHGRNETHFLRNDNIMIYPSPVFYPYFWKDAYSPACVTEQTIAVHHWASSWDQQPCVV